MRPLIVMLSVTLGLSAAYAAHDVSCYEIIEPKGDYIEAGVPITSKLGIANLGAQKEPSSGFFPVKFEACEYDPEFADSALISNVAPGDSMEVEMSREWIPEVWCKDYVNEDEGPFAKYEISGFVRLDDFGDDNPSNDTVRDTLVCLFSHDVGVIELTWPEEPSSPPDYYEPGSTITPTVVVENFGFHKGYNVPVRFEVVDISADTLVCWMVQTIDSLDWRGNELGNPCSCTVIFPKWVVPEGPEWFCLVPEARTEMAGDLCPEDDYTIIYVNMDPPPPCGEAIGEIEAAGRFWFETTGIKAERGYELRFSIPHSSWVRMELYDESGRWVRTLANDIYPPGVHTLDWDGKDYQSQGVSSGVYLIRMEAGSFNATRKVVVR